MHDRLSPDLDFISDLMFCAVPLIVAEPCTNTYPFINQLFATNLEARRKASHAKKATARKYPDRMCPEIENAD